MPSNEPYSQLEGQRLKVYVAPVGTAVTAVNSTPSGSWVELGATDGEQTIQLANTTNKFYDNDHQGPVKATRSQEDPVIMFTLVGLTQEHFARVMDQVSDVATAAGPPATKTTPLKRGAAVNEYAMIFKGTVQSPYGALPGQYVVPRGFFQNDVENVFAKDGRASIACEFAFLEDDDQSDANRLGWWVVQTA